MGGREEREGERKKKREMLKLDTDILFKIQLPRFNLEISFFNC